MIKLWYEGMNINNDQLQYLGVHPARVPGFYVTHSHVPASSVGCVFSAMDQYIQHKLYHLVI
jgi:hypothetical protein